MGILDRLIVLPDDLGHFVIRWKQDSGHVRVLVHFRLLAYKTNPDPLPQAYDAGIRTDFAREDLQQGGFARAVFPYQGQFLTLRNTKREPLEEPMVMIGFGKLLRREKNTHRLPFCTSEGTEF